jgi:lipopolysaccharide biosynthesis regulator YciM
MLNQSSPIPIVFQNMTADPIEAAKENHAKLIDRISNIVTQNHVYFITLGKLVSNQLTTINNPQDSDNPDFPEFINRTITLHLNSVEDMLNECLKSFNGKNSSLIKSIIKISRK